MLSGGTRPRQPNFTGADNVCFFLTGVTIGFVWRAQNIATRLSNSAVVKGPRWYFSGVCGAEDWCASAIAVSAYAAPMKSYGVSFNYLESASFHLVVPGRTRKGELSKDLLKNYPRIAGRGSSNLIVCRLPRDKEAVRLQRK